MGCGAVGLEEEPGRTCCGSAENGVRSRAVGGVEELDKDLLC